MLTGEMCALTALPASTATSLAIPTAGARNALLVEGRCLVPQCAPSVLLAATVMARETVRTVLLVLTASVREPRASLRAFPVKRTLTRTRVRVSVCRNAHQASMR